MITASSRRQAEGYEAELRWRHREGRIPSGAAYLVGPDSEDRRIGSRGATLHALRVLAAESVVPAGDLEEWLGGQRVLMIALRRGFAPPAAVLAFGQTVQRAAGQNSLGRAEHGFRRDAGSLHRLVERLPSGLVVGSGDVILTFDAAALDWIRDGVSGVAILQPAEAGTHHGAYVTDERGRVSRSFRSLRSPS